MLYGRVIGQATATMKHPTMRGWKLSIVLPLGPDRETPDGDPVLTIDRLGAEPGTTVVLSSDGNHIGELVGNPATPVCRSVVGIVDDRSARQNAT
ncbi:MAG TPA: ethanolamine utilization protein EutN [Planctomycetaceae bacterium]|nr:ethanolamine utilization protein EutN [Planctomycetaceae bacterium]